MDMNDCREILKFARRHGILLWTEARDRWLAMGKIEGSVAPTAGGPLDPAGWNTATMGHAEVNRVEDDSAGRALTTVNSDDFSPKPAPKTAEAD